MPKGPSDGGVARLEHIEGLNLVSDTDAVPPTIEVLEKKEKWTIKDIDTPDNRKWLTTMEKPNGDPKMQLGATSSSKHILTGDKERTEQWRFVDASDYPDYPPGYGDGFGSGDGDGFPGAGDRPLKDGETYFIVDDYDRPP